MAPPPPPELVREVSWYSDNSEHNFWLTRSLPALRCASCSDGPSPEEDDDDDEVGLLRRELTSASASLPGEGNRAAVQWARPGPLLSFTDTPSTSGAGAYVLVASQPATIPTTTIPIPHDIHTHPLAGSGPMLECPPTPRSWGSARSRLLVSQQQQRKERDCFLSSSASPTQQQEGADKWLSDSGTMSTAWRVEHQGLQLPHG